MELALDLQRRHDLRRSGLNGIDDAEPGVEPGTLRLRLFRPLAEPLSPHNVRIDGGERVRDLRVTHLLVEPDAPDAPARLVLRLDRPGDFSTYRVRLVQVEDGRPGERPLPGFDPVCSTLHVRLRDPGSGGDCGASPRAGGAPVDEPEIDYLARDFASLRELILDRLALLVPGVAEPHLPDLGVALVDLLAYTGDYLSYQQDAVATEAYLQTARLRISVRRHARLVDYRLHEGCNARTWVQVASDQDFTVENPHAVRIVGDWPGPLPADAGAVGPAALAGVAPGGVVEFAPLQSTPWRVVAAHGAMRLHAWGSAHFVLPVGATRATLIDMPATPSGAPDDGTRPLAGLAVGDVVLLQEARDPRTGAVVDVDPAHRHAVRLTAVVPDVDPLYDLRLLHVEWAAADALPFALTVSAIGPAPGCMRLGPAEGTDLALACGNVVLADHGRRIAREVLGQVGDGDRFRPRLQVGGITCRCPVDADAPASAALAQDPRAALPQIDLRAIPGGADGSAPVFELGDLDDPGPLAGRLAAALKPHQALSLALQDVMAHLSLATLHALRGADAAKPVPAAALQALGADLHRAVERWTPAADLLESGADDAAFVAEIDDDGIARLRFGDGTNGRVPAAGALFFAAYRVGCGPDGNVGAQTLRHLVLPMGALAGVRPTNPLPATGGIAPEAVADAKRRAPTALRATLERAITADDYATIAALEPGVQRAAATLRWTGSRTVVDVAVDPLGSETLAPALAQAVARRLRRVRRIGHEVAVAGAAYVPLAIALRVDVLAGFVAAEVRQAVEDALGTRALADGTLGFFHPDALTFGTAIAVSRLVGRVQAVAGVDSVDVTRLERLFLGPDDELENGVLVIGPLEIARLDNDPSLPENGQLVVRTRGGR